MRDLSPNELLSVEENIVRYSVQEAEKGIKVEYAFLSYEDYSNLVASFGSRVQFVEVTKNNEKFEGMMFKAAIGSMLIFPDSNIEKGTVAFFGNSVAPRSLYKLIKNNNNIKELT